MLGNDTYINVLKVTILILIDGFLQSDFWRVDNKHGLVTILILIDGFLQYKQVMVWMM